ncbi:MAG: hypothetical protein IJP98_05800 [Clostridia bacterium]|nr:hypothetical protein [Clostridia bacterium]
MIDYLLVDYFISLIICHNRDIAESIQRIPKNYNFYILRQHMNDAYDAEKFYEMINASPFHVLTYKKPLTRTIDNGLLSNYGYLLSRNEE